MSKSQSNFTSSTKSQIGLKTTIDRVGGFFTSNSGAVGNRIKMKILDQNRGKVFDNAMDRYRDLI
jgi:hypothetical protein